MLTGFNHTEWPVASSYNDSDPANEKALKVTYYYGDGNGQNRSIPKETVSVSASSLRKYVNEMDSPPRGRKVLSPKLITMPKSC